MYFFYGSAEPQRMKPRHQKCTKQPLCTKYRSNTVLLERDYIISGSCPPKSTYAVSFQPHVHGLWCVTAIVHWTKFIGCDAWPATLVHAYEVQFEIFWLFGRGNSFLLMFTGGDAMRYLNIRSKWYSSGLTWANATLWYIHVYDERVKLGQVEKGSQI